MKRDMDLIRKLLSKIESLDSRRPSIGPFDDYDQDVIDHHIVLLKDAGLLMGPPTIEIIEDVIGGGIGNTTTYPALNHSFFCLSWAGHEFLAEARDDTKWNTAKSLATEKGGGLAFEVVKLALGELSKQALRAAMGLPGS